MAADSAHERAIAVGELEATVREHTAEMLWVSGAGLLGGLLSGHLMLVAACLLGAAAVFTFRHLGHLLLGAFLAAAAAIAATGSAWQAAQTGTPEAWLGAAYCGLVAMQAMLACIAAGKLNRLLATSISREH